jgi:hypothetical protein
VPDKNDHPDLYSPEPIDGLLPHGLISLDLHLYSYPFTPLTFPSSLTRLYVSHVEPAAPFGTVASFTLTPDMFPPSLTDLQLNIRLSTPLLPGVLPPYLTSLDLTTHQPILTGVLPPLLTTCTLNDPFDFSPSLLPPSLTHLTMDHHVPPFDSEPWPPSLTSLSTPLPAEPLRPNLHIFPSSLTHLTITGSGRAPLVPGVLPSSLTVLELEGTEWFIEEKDAMPPSLVEMRLERCPTPVDATSLPSSVRRVRVRRGQWIGERPTTLEVEEIEVTRLP